MMGINGKNAFWIRGGKLITGFERTVSCTGPVRATVAAVERCGNQQHVNNALDYNTEITACEPVWPSGNALADDFGFSSSLWLSFLFKCCTGSWTLPCVNLQHIYFQKLETVF